MCWCSHTNSTRIYCFYYRNTSPMVVFTGNLSTILFSDVAAQRSWQDAPKQQLHIAVQLRHVALHPRKNCTLSFFISGSLGGVVSFVQNIFMIICVCWTTKKKQRRPAAEDAVRSETLLFACCTDFVVPRVMGSTLRNETWRSLLKPIGSGREETHLNVDWIGLMLK